MCVKVMDRDDDSDGELDSVAPLLMRRQISTPGEGATWRQGWKGGRKAGRTGCKEGQDGRKDGGPFPPSFLYSSLPPSLP